MPLPDALTRALHEAQIPVELDAPLARRTWWRVGGPADGLAQVGSVGQLAAAMRAAHAAGVEVMVLGNASNLLVADAGIRGLVLTLRDELAQAWLDGRGRLVAGAGLKLTVLLRRAAAAGWPGLELFAGIPGTVGGAVRMNAGQRLGEVSDILHSVDVVLVDGTHATLAAAELSMSYRTALLPEGAVIASATLALHGDVAASQRHIAKHLAYRAATQPLDQRTCGSTFRNPPGDSAGRLIEAAGLKGFRIGDALVSPKHANFVVNAGAASAADLLAVIEHMERVVLEVHGVKLVREVHLVGDWGGA